MPQRPPPNAGGVEIVDRWSLVGSRRSRGLSPHAWGREFFPLPADGASWFNEGGEQRKRADLGGRGAPRGNGTCDCGKECGVHSDAMRGTGGAPCGAKRATGGD